MNLIRLTILPLIAAIAVAASPRDMSGTWTFDPAKSENAGMMAQMQITLTLHQSGNELVEKIDATMMNQHQVQEVRLELNGKAVSNPNYMGENSTTVSHWDGAKLVTKWTTPGAVPGTIRESTETFGLSGDGQLLTVKTSRAGKQDVVMVYRRK